jgi:hypothetical protein
VLAHRITEVEHDGGLRNHSLRQFRQAQLQNEQTVPDVVEEDRETHQSRSGAGME